MDAKERSHQGMIKTVMREARQKEADAWRSELINLHNGIVLGLVKLDKDSITDELEQIMERREKCLRKGY